MASDTKLSFFGVVVEKLLGKSLDMFLKEAPDKYPLGIS